MRVQTMIAVIAAMVAMGTLQAAAAEPRCLSQDGTFGVGQYACLNVGDRGKLALCETTQGVMSWRTVQDYCPGNLPQQAPQAAESEPNCLANLKSYGTGRLACLDVGGVRYLARCDLVLNASSWTKVQDDCPGNPPLNVQQEPDEGSWKALKKPRQLLDRLLGRP